MDYNTIRQKILDLIDGLIEKLEKVDPFDTDKCELKKTQGELASYNISINPGSPLHNPDLSASITMWLDTARKELVGRYTDNGRLIPLTESEICVQQGYIAGIVIIKNLIAEVTTKQKHHSQLMASWEKSNQEWKKAEEKMKESFKGDLADLLPDIKKERERQREFENPIDDWEAEAAEEHGYSKSDGYDDTDNTSDETSGLNPHS